MTIVGSGVGALGAFLVCEAKAWVKVSIDACMEVRLWVNSCCCCNMEACITSSCACVLCEAVGMDLGSGSRALSASKNRAGAERFLEGRASPGFCLVDGRDLIGGMVPESRMSEAAENGVWLDDVLTLCGTLGERLCKRYSPCFVLKYKQ